jgi:DNA-binding CsgD family transcriptional regulator/tetratricopeptide (TPR) repeat protein
MIGTMARRMTSPVLVGREALVAQLEAALEAAREGQPRHAVVGGEAGVGKTRLLGALRESAEQQGIRVLVGRCVSMGEAGLPFAPYTEILRSMASQEGAATVAALAGRGAADLARLVPALGPDEPAPSQELWARTRLQEALLDLLLRLAGRTPLLVQLEDLHWADAGTLSATAYLLRALQGSPTMLMATFRADEVRREHPLRPWLAEVSRDARVERIDLRPLAAADTADLVRNILGEDLAASEVAEIQRRSDGNPFFIEELLASRSGPTAVLPATLRDVLLARVDALPTSARHVIGVAAVGGRDVEHDMLVTVLDGSGSGWDRDLLVLVEAGLLLPTRALDDDDAYSFRHALLQEAVYDAALPTERRRLHRAWGEALAAHHTDPAPAADLVNLAHHWREARDERALQASIVAGDAAMAGYSYAIAAGQYEQALLLWDAAEVPPPGLDHVDLLERASRAAYLASQHRRAVALCRAALAELGEGELARRTTLQTLLGRTLWVSGDYAASIEAYEEGLRSAPAEPPIVRARAQAGLGQVYMLHSRHAEARSLCEEAIATARAIGARDLEGHGLNTLGVALTGLGQISAAHESIAAALVIALELGIPDDIGRAYVNRADIEHWSGDPERALATSIEGLQVAADWGVSSSYGAWIGYGAVTFAFEVGRWDQAAWLLAEADRIVGSPETAMVYRAAYSMEYLAGTGDHGFEAIWERVRRTVSGSPLSDDLVTILQGGLTFLAFAGRTDEAVVVVRQAVELIGDLGTSFRASELSRIAAWAVADAVLADRSGSIGSPIPDADALMARLADLAQGWQGRLADPGPRLSELLRLDGRQVAAEAGRMRGADVADDWAALADGWTALGRPFRTAIARWRESGAAERAGDRVRAIEALRESHRLGTTLGAAPLVGHLETMARRLRVRLTAGAPETDPGDRGDVAPYGLTRREREVLVAVAAGRTNRQIAEALFISESTAGVHVSNILGKLGVSTRTEAAGVAIEQGLTDRAGH